MGGTVTRDDDQELLAERSCCGEEMHLTVLKTSHFFAGDGFTVYDSDGGVAFRVDSYGGLDSRDQQQLVLMNATGKCLFTVRKKWPSLHNRWEGFVGEREEGQKPIFSVRRSSIIGRSGVTVEVYGGASGPPAGEYQIEGSYPQRRCTFFDARREVVAEIKRKVAAAPSNVVLDKDVFSLILRPGFDAAFAMALVLVLDQIDSGDDVAAAPAKDYDDNGVSVDDPTWESSSSSSAGFSS